MLEAGLVDIPVGTITGNKVLAENEFTKTAYKHGHFPDQLKVVTKNYNSKIHKRHFH